MKQVKVTILILFFLSIFSGAWAQAPHSELPLELRHALSHFSPQPSVRVTRHLPALPNSSDVRRLPEFSSPAINQIACPLEAEQMGAVCGFVSVPFDRSNPQAGTIPINVELYRHTNPGPAESAILMNFGGPGNSTTGFRSESFNLFQNNLDVHDMLLIDDRGRGSSGDINCQELQQGTAAWETAMSDCVTQLGTGASRYGTGDIAQDTEAVRAAFGYEKIDYFGWSYGGADVTAYATRYGEHLRSIVLDSPYGPPALNQFAFQQFRAAAQARMVELSCSRSPTCAPDHPSPTAEIDGLIQTSQLAPVQGEAHDASGNSVQVKIDEDALLNFVFANMTGNFVSAGEVLAAAKSLTEGDSAPLLRLGAEGSYSLQKNNGDPANYSVGARYSTACMDADVPWTWTSSIAARQQQYDHAVSALSADYFAPFSTAAATGTLFSWFGAQCLYAQKPGPASPLLPANPTYPSVPTLIMSGDMDNVAPLEETTKVAALYPQSTYVKVAEAGHLSVVWSVCAANLASTFVENLSAGNTSCAATPETVFPAVGRFPVLAKNAIPATPDSTGLNQIDKAELQAVTVAVAAATDALKRSSIGSGSGVGLRGGTFQSNFGVAQTITLNNCAFSQDVIVNGTVTLASDNSVAATLTLSGPGTAGGSINIVGFWQLPGLVGNFEVTGTIGSKRVSALVPEA